MGKIVTIYAGFTSAQIKTRASFPDAADIVDNTTYIECSKLTFTKLKNALSESIYKLSELVGSGNVNIYSWFGSGYWILSGGVLVYDNAGVLPPYPVGLMAAYNHNAAAPSKSSLTNDKNYNEGSPYATTAIGHIDVEEINWRDSVLANINQVGMRLTGPNVNSTTLITYDDASQQSGFDFSAGFTTAQGVYTQEFGFYLDGVKVCPIPNIANHAFSVTELAAASIGTVTMDAALQAVYPTGVVVYDPTSNVNQFTDEYTFNNIAIDTSGNGDGDVTRFNMDLFARLNGGKWGQVYDGFTITSSGFTITDDALPWDIVGGDIIDFELRDGA